ncbi:cell division protein FtsB [Thermonema lapsum]|jgi:cell division protein FtsB|uniref:Cell division protein FtsB n=1 Tax=Thermonema lapsum TaxID=28195 RepID=A0A846MT63_9BACT|nr:septum formation initiator family protein [Thermonema lapsum]NIK74786.1 cell division protein FtsB [Thermonema lapsum]
MRRRLLTLVGNFYVLVGGIFALWMLFFDSNDLITQWKRKREIERLQQQRQYYLEAIELIKEERRALENDPALLEKFAREKYYMHRSQEDVFILQSEKE